MRVLSAALLLASVCADDRIVNLPGWNGTQEMYAGYINVNASHGRNLFYWLVESAGNPDTDPLVLWTNGGPGCSGLSGGLFSELGPFFPNQDGSLSLTPNLYTWTQMANVIFIEQPAGVGFSYSQDTDDYNVGDFQAAEDVYHFLVNFVARYPQYANRKLYLSGESYGGHYIPTEAAAIVRGNAAGANPKLNLAGFFVGNAWTVAELDNIGALEYWYTRTMIDNTTRNGVLATCNMSDVGPLLAGRTAAEADWELAAGVPLGSKRRPLGFTPLRDAATGRAVTWSAGAAPPTDCDGWSNQAFDLLGNINIYDSYVDVCATGSSRSGKAARLLTATGQGYAAPPSSNNAAGCSTTYDPCRDDKTTAYLNNAAVKAAIHANASITWTGCSNIINYSRYDLLSSMLPVYEFLFDAGIQMLVYSGDVDAIVPSLGTRAWLAKLPLVEVEPIRTYTVDGQVGGWTTKYDKITFATVRNAGHFVPELQGSRGLYLIRQFLAGAPL